MALSSADFAWPDLKWRTSHARARAKLSSGTEQKLCINDNEEREGKKKKKTNEETASISFVTPVLGKARGKRIVTRRKNPFKRYSRRYYCRRCSAINVPAVFFYCRDCCTTRYSRYCCYCFQPDKERISFSARSVRQAGGSNSVLCTRTGWSTTSRSLL